MAELEFGLKRGMAYRVPFEQYAQEQQNNYVLAKHAQAEQVAKAKLFADDFDYNTAMNEYDNPRVKELARGQFQKIGEFIRQNPNYERDPQAMLQLKMMRKELKDNPVLNRGLQSDAAHNEMMKFMVDPKNASVVNDPQFQKEYVQGWENYKKFGHKGGEAASRTMGPQTFSFIPPEQFDDEAYLADRASKIPIQERWLKGTEHGLGATVGDVLPERAQLEASNILSDPKVGYKYKDIWQNKLSPAERSLYGNPVNWLGQRVINHTKTDLHAGNFPSEWFKGHDGAGAGTLIDPFTTEIDQKENGTVPVQAIDAIAPLTIDPNDQKGKVYTPTAGMPLKVLRTGKDGKQSFQDVTGYAGTPLASVPTGNHKTIGGVKYVEIKSVVKVQPHLATGDNPLFENKATHWWGSADTPGEDAGDYGNVEGNADVAQLIPPTLKADGKENPETANRALITNWVPANTNAGNKLRYNKIQAGQSDADKVYGRHNPVSPKVFKDEAGNLFTQDAKGNYIPYKH